MNRAVPNRQIAEEAAEWAVRIDGGVLAPEERRALSDWLRASPAHVDELLYSASILAGLEDVDRERKLSLDACLAEAASGVIPLFQDRRPRVAAAAAKWVHGRPGKSSGAAAPRGSVAVAASLAAIAFVGLLLTPRASQDSEALFEVAHEPFRPFRVMAAGTMTEAVGTKFNVRRTPSGVQVVVVEGKVLVDSKTVKAREAVARGVGNGPLDRIKPCSGPDKKPG